MTRAPVYRHLFTPLRIGPVMVANRIVFSAHLTNYARGRPPERAARRLLRRPGGRRRRPHHHRGALHPPDRLALREADPRLPPGGRPRLPAHHRRRPRPRRARSSPRSTTTAARPRACTPGCRSGRPSPVPDPLFREVPKAVEPPRDRRDRRRLRPVAEHCMSRRLRRDRAAVLALVHRAGLPLPGHQPPHRRVRGPLANRARLLLEIVDAVREAIGAGPALGVRLCGDELIEGGTDHRRRRRRWPGWSRPPASVDYINTSIGVATATLYMIEASMQVPPGLRHVHPQRHPRGGRPAGGRGRPLQGSPAGRPGPATTGHCDLVGVVRGQIADADFAAKARAGHAGDIRTCLSCNQECVGRMGLNRWLGCIENPRTGREVDAPSPRPAGAGAGGWWWSGRARRAAGRGHGGRAGPPGRPLRAADRLGGQVPVAAIVPSRAELLDITRNQVARPGGSGSTSASASRPTPTSSAADAPTWWWWPPGRPARPWWAGDTPRVVDVRDVLEGRADPTGGWWSSTSSGSTRPPRWPSCWPTGAARWRSSPTAWSSARISASPSTSRPGT